MTRRRVWIPALALLLALALAVIGWVLLAAWRAENLADPKRARRQGRPIPVRTARAERTEAERVIGAAAVTVPSQTASIRVDMSRSLRFERGGVVVPSGVLIKSVKVSEGEQVGKGQLLVELDSETYKAIVRQSKASLAAAQAMLDVAELTANYEDGIRELELSSAEAEMQFRIADLANWKKLYEATEKLYRSKVATMVAFYDANSRHIEAEYKLAEAERRLQKAKDAMTIGLLRDKRSVEQAAAALEAARVGFELASRNLRTCLVQAPIEGVVDRVQVVPGQIVAVSFVLAEIVTLDPLHVKMYLPQQYSDEVSVGRQAEVILDSRPDETFTGKVVALAARADTESRTLPVIIVIPNPGNRIRAGVSGFVRLRIRAELTAVPATGVIRQGDKAMAFRVEEGRARIRQVEIGPPVGSGLLEVRTGLAPGDEVVVHGNAQLQDNDAVDSDWRKWTRRQ